MTWTSHCIEALIARFVGPTWGPSGADRTQVGPMLAPWTLLSRRAFLITGLIMRGIQGYLSMYKITVVCLCHAYESLSHPYEFAWVFMSYRWLSKPSIWDDNSMPMWYGCVTKSSVWYNYTVVMLYGLVNKSPVWDYNSVYVIRIYKLIRYLY